MTGSVICALVYHGLVFATMFSVAGAFHVVLLRSDGTAVASGLNFHGECSLISMESAPFRFFRRG